MTKPLNTTDLQAARPFLAAAILALWVSSTFGLLAAIPHGWPATMSVLNLPSLRPFHTTFAIAWIFLGYQGALIAWLPKVAGRPWGRPRLFALQFGLQAIAGLLATWAYLNGRFTGREYMEFPLSAFWLIELSWGLFLFQFVGLLRSIPRPWPAYLWMWLIGLVMFPLTLAEGHLYLLPHYAQNLVRDTVVQWKAYGTLVGSWNMVLYGLSIYLTERITGDRSVGSGTEAFLLFWLGLLNMLFNFSHHTYALPEALWVREMAYGISMTEWIVLMHLILTRFRPSPPPVSEAHQVAKLFLGASVGWTGLNLLLAILLSIPAVNVLTHGSYVTVVHAMGSTIGINTMIVLAAGFAVLLEARPTKLPGLRALLAIVQVTLAMFLLALLLAGSVRGVMLLQSAGKVLATPRDAQLFLRLMVVTGGALWVGIGGIAFCWLKALRGPAVTPARPDRPPVAIA